jgi:hypothetical protein
MHATAHKCSYQRSHSSQMLSQFQKSSHGFNKLRVLTNIATCRNPSLRRSIGIFWLVPQADLRALSVRARCEQSHQHRVSHYSTRSNTMFKRFTLATMLAVLLGATASTAYADPRHQPRNVLINRQIPQTGAEWWQSRGIAEEMGMVYRR